MMMRFNIISVLTKTVQSVLYAHMLVFEVARVLLRLASEMLRVIRRCIGMNGRRVILYMNALDMKGSWAGRVGRGWSNMTRHVVGVRRPVPAAPATGPAVVDDVAVKGHGNKRKPVTSKGAARGVNIQPTLPDLPHGAQPNQPQEMTNSRGSDWADAERGQEEGRLNGLRERGPRTDTPRRSLQNGARPESDQETDGIDTVMRDSPLCPSTQRRKQQTARQVAKELFSRRQLTSQSVLTRDRARPEEERQDPVLVFRSGRNPMMTQCETVSAQDSNSNRSRRPTPQTTSSMRHQGIRATTLMMLSLTLMNPCLMISEASGKEYNLENREYDPELMYSINTTAFDCLKPDPKSWRSVDITRLQPCPNIDHDYMSVKNVTASLVQSGLAVGTEVIRCDIKITQQVRGYESGTHWGATQEKMLSDDRPVFLSGNHCRGLAASREFVCDTTLCGGHKNSPPIAITMGNEVQTSYYAAGHYVDGFSESQEFYYKAYGTDVVRKYRGVMEVIIKIKVSNHSAFFDPQLDRIWSEELPFQAKWSMQGSAVDIDHYGTLAWEHREPQCEERLGVIAAPSVTSIRRLKPKKRPGNGMQEYAGALAIMLNSTEQRASGVVISDEKHLCLEQCFLTNVPQLLICLGGEDEIKKLDRIETRLLDSNTIARINAQTQGTHLHLSSKLEMVSISKILHEKICDLDSRATRQDFAQLLNGPSPYALQGLATGIDEYPSFGHNGTAYTVSIRGSTAYFALCPSEEVQLVALPKCSLQIPVVRSDGTLAFVDAINRHIIDIPTWVECDSGLPVQFYIDGVYYCQGVDTIDVCSARNIPTVLQPSVGKVRGLKVDDLPALGGLTINHKQTQMISEIVREQEYGKVIQKKLVRATIESTDEMTEGNGGLVGIRLGIPLSGIDIALVANGVAERLYFMFQWFGDLYLNFIGIAFIISLARQVVFFWIRVHRVRKIYGCGKWMFYAFFNSLWVTLAMPKLVLKAVYDKAEEEFSKQRVDDMPIPDNAQLARKHKELCDSFAMMQNAISTLQVLNQSTVYPVGDHSVNKGNTQLNLALARLEGKPYSRFENGWVYDQEPRSPRQQGRDRPGNGTGDNSSHYSTCTQEGETRSPCSEVPSTSGSGQGGVARAQSAIQQPQGSAGGAAPIPGIPGRDGVGLSPALSSFGPGTGDYRAAPRVDGDPMGPPDFDPSQMRARKGSDPQDRK